MGVLWILGTVLAFLALVLSFLRFSPTVGKGPGRKEQEGFARRTPLFFQGAFHNEKSTGPRRAATPSPSLGGRRRPSRDLPFLAESLPAKGEKGGLSLVWYGHSTVLIQLGTSHILLDPIFSLRASPVPFAGPKRFSYPSMGPADLPELDVVFLSHDHYDHLDWATIRKIDPLVHHYVLPLGVDSYLRGWGISEEKLHPLAWWESVELEGVRYTLTAAQHFSSRHPLHPGATLWGGLAMDDGVHRVCFTGDSGFHDGFAKVGRILGEVDLLLADSAQYNVAWASSHMTPEEAVQAAKEMGAKWLLPVHWGAFVLSDHAWNDPPRRARIAARAAGVRVATPKLGQVLRYEEMEQGSEAWWEEEEKDEVSEDDHV